jgi:ribose-phosphate pyrophosphokinase
MMPLVIALPGNEMIAERLAALLDAAIGKTEIRRFPDGETYVRLDSPVKGCEVILVCTLDRPDAKFLPLVFVANTAREMGARRIGLVSPYLAYMRQDRRFRPGEALTSVQFAAAISSAVDWLATVDPHLHRRKSLSEIYSVPAATVQAAPRLSAWIRENVSDPLVIGPDAESEQWVQAVAAAAAAPFTVLEKERLGDRAVRISRLPSDLHGRTPVLLDDIISTGRTMVETVNGLRAAGHPAPVCLGVHAIFADGAYEELRRAGAKAIVTCNTVSHDSNGIEIMDLVARGVEWARAAESHGADPRSETEATCGAVPRDLEGSPT